MIDSRLATVGASAPQETERAYLLRCGNLYVGESGNSRVSSVERARRMPEGEAREMLGHLCSPHAVFPLPWEMVPAAGGAR